jgi:hypothetical protein
MNRIGPFGQSPCARTTAGAATLAATPPISRERRRTVGVGVGGIGLVVLSAVVMALSG